MRHLHDALQIVEKKKKQQRMVIFIAAGVGIAVMMGYWFMTNNAANHSVTARVVFNNLGFIKLHLYSVD